MDEIGVLKGEKKGLKFKASKMDEQAGKDKDERDEQKDGGQRPSLQKRCKTQQPKIHEHGVSCNKHLDRLVITKPRHRQIAAEGALLESVLYHGFVVILTIIRHKAVQFKLLFHGLCWVPTERLIRTLIPLNDDLRQDIARVRDKIWSLYAELKAYKQRPTAQRKAELQARFDTIFTQKTRFETLNQTLKQIHRKKSELLLALERPEVPLHTNGSEADIRNYVIKKKVSGGTLNDFGRQCRETFAILKKICRRLGISFWDYLCDHMSGANKFPPLPEIVCQRFAND